MNNTCMTCKYWTSNFLKERHSSNFCENRKVINSIFIEEVDLPSWICPRIVKHFVCGADFGCKLYEDSCLVWGEDK